MVTGFGWRQGGEVGAFPKRFVMAEIIFRDIRGLEGRCQKCRKAALMTATASDVPFASLAGEHMLACQEALPKAEQKLRRIEVLREALRRVKG